MRTQLREELLENGDKASVVKALNLGSGPARTMILLGLAVVLLLGAAMIGLVQLYELRGVEGGQNAWRFFVPAGLLAGPMLLLGIAAGAWMRQADRARVADSYQERLSKLQNRLNYREDLLRLIADHRSGSIAIFDQHNRYWFVNQPAANAIGRQPMEIIGKNAGRILGTEKAKRLELRLAEARVADGPIERIDRTVNEKGETQFIQTRYASVSPLAELTGGVLVSEDDLTSLIVERERRERMLRQVIDTLVAVVDRRDPYAAGHSARVGQLARAIAGEMGLDGEMIETAEIAGSLMNFGKVLVSRNVLTKTTALTPEELQRVRDSILISADILAIIGFDGPVVPTLRQVLERFDGTGVPDGLKGEDISVTARIVSVANAFVALVSPRAHREGLQLQDALRNMMAEAGKAYDHRVLIALSNYIENRPNKLDWLTSNKQG